MQRSGGDDENEIIFVIEACQKSGQAEYHTRINEAKYIEYFNKGKFISAGVAVSVDEGESVMWTACAKYLSNC